MLAKKLSYKYKIIGCGRRKLKCNFQDYYQVNLSNTKETNDWIDQITKKYKNIYGLINNASVIPVQHPALLYDAELVNEVTLVNIASQTILIKNISKYFLKKKKRGRIINISSMAAALNENGTSIYAASKIFIEKFLSIFSKELSKTKITCNTIGITYFSSQTFKQLNKLILSRSYEKTNISRTLTIQEVLHTINFFLDEKSDIVSGQKLYLGMSL